MAKISSYASDNSISLSDKLIGTDAENNDATKNFEIGELISFINNPSNLTGFVPLGNLQSYSLVTQQHTTINTNKNVEFEFGSFSSGVTISSNQINFNSVGKFMIDVKVRLEHTGGGGDAQISMWLKYPTTNVNNSRQVYTVANTHIQELSYNFVINVASASDSVYVQWATSNLAAKLIPVLAAGIYPTAPSAIVNVYRIG